MLPSQETVDEVIREAQAFWQAHPEFAIAIHCAYGALSAPVLTAEQFMAWYCKLLPVTMAL